MAAARSPSRIVEWVPWEQIHCCQATEDALGVCRAHHYGPNALLGCRKALPLLPEGIVKDGIRKLLELVDG